MVLGSPTSVIALIEPAFTGVDGQTSMLLGFGSGAQAVLTCTSLAKSPTRAAIVGTNARIEIDGDFYAPRSFDADHTQRRARRASTSRTGARPLRTRPRRSPAAWREGLLESPLMPLDESISIMETMDAVLAQGSG